MDHGQNAKKVESNFEAEDESLHCVDGCVTHGV